MNTYRFSFLRRFLKKRYLCLWLMLLPLLVLVIEVLVYRMNSIGWPSLDCTDGLGEGECTKVLLVADPQLIGERNEPLPILSPITISDDDDYLQKTFRLAVHFSRPHLIVFLGDLFDEGSIATDAEFGRYVQRFRQVFATDCGAQHVWLPGDNDIGGEDYRDEVTDAKVERFERAFAQPEEFRHRNVKFFKVNRLTGKYHQSAKARDFQDVSTIYVALSHMPIVDEPTPFVDRMLYEMQPHLVFTGHRHKSMILTAHPSIETSCGTIPVPPENNVIYEYTLGTSVIYEIVVPTCTYRMNTDKIGYGFAVIEKNRLRYAVLWSPSRFKQIFIYLIFIFYSVILAFCLCFCTRSKIPVKKNL